MQTDQRRCSLGGSEPTDGRLAVVLAIAATCLTLLLPAAAVFAGGVPGAPDYSDLAGDVPTMAEGWMAITDPLVVLSKVLKLVIAFLLAAALVFHPRSTPVDTLDGFRSRHVVMFYAIVSATIAQIVAVSPAMGLVIFGIGGLYRFRTELGEPRRNGQAIWATVLGLACGLNLFGLAVVLTAFTWVSLWVIGARVPRRLVLRGVPADRLGEVAAAYQAAIVEIGCRTVGERRQKGKKQVSFIITGPRHLFEGGNEPSLRVSESLQAKVEWQAQ